MGKQYRHLSVEDRAVIMIERSKGVSLRAIGRTLGRAVSTVSRERAVGWAKRSVPTRTPRQSPHAAHRKVHQPA